MTWRMKEIDVLKKSNCIQDGLNQRVHQDQNNVLAVQEHPVNVSSRDVERDASLK